MHSEYQFGYNDLVREASCSVGAFYGRFANKAAALYGFYARNCEELEMNAAELLDPGRTEGLGVILEQFTSLVVRHCFRCRSDEFSAPANRDTALFVLALVRGMSRDAVVNGRRLVGKGKGFGVGKFENELTRAVIGYMGLRS